MQPPEENPKTAEKLTATSGADLRADGSDLPVRIGRYRILGFLGRGGFGAVFLASDEQLHRKVAIKIPRKRMVRSAAEAEAYLAEARVLARLDHPHIVPVYDVGQTADGDCYIVSKFVEGKSLAMRLRESTWEGWRAAASLATTIAEALHHAHRRGIVHRDVKPGNILLDLAGQAYLADFGLALREEDFGKASRYGGTPSYMSPEQARGEGHLVDGRTDVFSLGVVLYELITATRPFRGTSPEELLDRITSFEPQPPRQIRDTIPRELERICLRALSKRAADRYANAGEMASELRHLLADSSELSAAEPRAVADRRPISALDEVPSTATGGSTEFLGERPVVPKGLRSFDRHDADFFLSLLPGPRAGDGLPESIRFWKSRIEAGRDEEAFRVGVLYGPSGCGKSSLIKAGLLPRLDDAHVVSAYVEATVNDTAVRLLRRLRNDFPHLPQRADLRESIMALRRDASITGGKKVLIVLDQFEQWLHGESSDGRAALAAALRQCDGQRVQCLLAVRDEFWLGLSRFLAELEVDLVAGRNAALVDLFDERHARRVLAALGRAYEALPAGALSPQQQEFIELAVKSLADDGKVVCVRVTLLAEMIKARPWEPAVLRELGGAEGIGAMFLEETFSASTADPRFRQHATAAQAVLKALLPLKPGDIRGNAQTHSALLEASGYTRRPAMFEDLLRILDGELRLLTPVEHVESAEEPLRSESAHAAYQLTHDYLVPSMQEWLARKQRETASGRAALRMAEQAMIWDLRPEARRLPSLWEWSAARLLTKRRTWTQPQCRMMRAAGRYHVARAALLAALLALLSASGFLAYRWQRAVNLVDRLLEAETSDAPEIARRLAGSRVWAPSLLRQAAATDHPRRRLHVSLGLLAHDPRQGEYLRQRLLEGEPVEVQVVREALQPLSAAHVPPLWAQLRDGGQPPSRRFRAACSLASLDPDNPLWPEYGELVSAWLTAESPVVVEDWARLLQPVRAHLLQPLKRLYGASQPATRCNATLALLEYLGDDVPRLASLNHNSNASQRMLLAGALRKHQAQAIPLLDQHLRQCVAAQQAEDDLSEARRIQLARDAACAATMLMLLGEYQPIWPLLGQNRDPQTRTAVIHGAAQVEADPGPLIQRLRAEPDPVARVALLLSLGEYKDSPLLSASQRASLLPYVLQTFQNDPHPGVHGACEWLMRSLGQQAEIERLQQAMASSQVPADRGWRVNGQGQTMVLIRGPVKFTMGSPYGEQGRGENEPLHAKTIPHSYEISAKNVTLAEFRNFWNDYDQSSLNPDHPVDSIDFFMAMAYCNWLSDVEQIDQDQRCFVEGPDGQLRPREECLSLSGYRLPTEAEWEYACRAHTNTARYFGCGDEFLAAYAWYRDNAQDTRHPVGQLKPNDFGMFDMYGNVLEWCVQRSEMFPGDQVGPEVTEGFLSVRSSLHTEGPRGHRSARRYASIAKSGLRGWGIRLARTLDPESEQVAKP